MVHDSLNYIMHIEKNSSHPNLIFKLTVECKVNILIGHKNY